METFRGFLAGNDKWRARWLAVPAGVSHLTIRPIIEESAGKFASPDLARADLRDEGLCGFQRELGAHWAPLPHSSLPKAPRHVSPQVLNGAPIILSRLWRVRSLPANPLLGAAFYGHLT